MTISILLAIGAIVAVSSAMGFRAWRHCYATNRSGASATPHTEEWIPEREPESEAHQVSPSTAVVPGIRLGRPAKSKSEAESVHNLLELAPEEFDAVVQAAIAGNPAAQHIVGRACETGVKTPQNELQAMQWFQLAANRGHMPAIRKVTNWK